MIQKQTVLVLGAGASRHLRFPLGQELIDGIIKFIYGTSYGAKKIFEGGGSEGRVEHFQLKNAQLLERFLELSNSKKANGEKYSSEDIKEFANHLFRAQPPSIDFFLQMNPQYSLLGKICIIFCISRHEDKDAWQYSPFRFPDNLGADLPVFGWYQYLWHKLIEGCTSLNDFKKNKITIITFNYDRSLEQYLIEAIKSFFGIDEGLAAEAFHSIKIKHVYGKLGKFYWEVNHLQDFPSQTPEEVMLETAVFTPWELKCFFRLMGEIGEYGMAMGDFDSHRRVLSQESRNQLISKFNRVAQDVKTFYEAINDQKKKIYIDDFAKAERIYFLGFGYHEENIKMLGLLDTEDHQKSKSIVKDNAIIKGTAIGMTSEEAEQVKWRITGLWSALPESVDIKHNWEGMDSDFPIISFFRNVAPLQ